MAKKTDLRVQRTRKMIIEAFFKLVETKGYEAVTIQDIADEAMINRATFYAHFKDKQHLYDAIFPLRLVLLPLFLIRNNWLMATVSA